MDPALKEITVTFDQDMGGGMSWTGAGPEFPSIPDGKQAHWRDKRTCVLPVKLQGGHHYRVGINSVSFRNFRSEAGVPALTSAELESEIRCQIGCGYLLVSTSRMGMT